MADNLASTDEIGTQEEGVTLTDAGIHQTFIGSTYGAGLAPFYLKGTGGPPEEASIDSYGGLQGPATSLSPAVLDEGAGEITNTRGAPGRKPWGPVLRGPRSSLLAAAAIAAIAALMVPLVLKTREGGPLPEPTVPVAAPEARMTPEEGPTAQPPGAPEGPLEEAEEGETEEGKGIEEEAPKHEFVEPEHPKFDGPFPSFFPRDSTAFNLFADEFLKEAPEGPPAEYWDGFPGGDPEALEGFKAFLKTCKDPLIAQRPPENEQQRRQRDWTLFRMQASWLSKAEAKALDDLSTVELKPGQDAKRAAINQRILEVYLLKQEAATEWRAYHAETGIHPNEGKDSLVYQFLRAQEVYYARMANKLQGRPAKSTPLAQNFKGDPRQGYKDACRELPGDRWMAHLMP